MKIDSINNILSSLSGKTQSASEHNGPKIQGSATQAAGDSEAARVSADLGLDESESASRLEKVNRLKQEIGAGTYNPDSREVATALLKELVSI